MCISVGQNRTPPKCKPRAALSSDQDNAARFIYERIAIMKFDPITTAREEAEDEEAEREEKLADFLAAIKCLLVNGEKKAAILLIEKVFPDN